MYKYKVRDLNMMVLDALGEEEVVRPKMRKPIDKAEIKGDLLFFVSIFSFGIIILSVVFYLWLWVWQYSVEDIILNFFK